MKKVSILIPCYNAEKFVAETLDCCLKQTYKNVEVVLVDDGSEDRSYDIAKTFESEEIRVFKQPNSGACHARNFAFEKSSGDYIIYLDADDIINPEFVEEHIRSIEDVSSKSVSFGVWDRFREHTNESLFFLLGIYKDYDSAFQLLLDMWVSGDMLACTCYMTPRELIAESGGWDETVLKNQDGEFFARVLMLADKAVFVPKSRIYYRTGEYLTVSKASSEKKVASMLDTFVSYKNHALVREDSKRVREALSINFTLFMYLYGNRFPKLYKRAKEEIKALGVGYILKNEPPRVISLCKVIGFNHFMFLRRILFNR